MKNPRRQRIAAAVLNGVILVQVFGLGMLAQRLTQTGFPWDKDTSRATTWKISVQELADRLGSLGYACLLHGEQPVPGLGTVSAKCDVGTKRFDLATYTDQEAARDGVTMSNSGMGCMLARLRGARHLAVAAGDNWSVFTTSLDDARFIANELNGYLITRECRSISST